MDCSRVRALVDVVLDGEADAATLAAVETHLATCAGCRASFDAARQASDAVRRFAHRHRAPAALAARIGMALPPAAPPAPARTRRRWWPRFVPTLGAGFASAALASLLTLWIAVPDRAAQTADDVVAAHVRSLLADHLTDVASSDQHTVRPWFAGKVDVAPPAVDLAAAGFPLAGGRLDYLDDRPVAAVVYRHGRHVINVFVAADTTPGDRPPQLRQHQGYNILAWRTAGLAFTAVSDSAPSELEHLAALLQSGSEETPASAPPPAR